MALWGFPQVVGYHWSKGSSWQTICLPAGAGEGWLIVEEFMFVYTSL